MKCTLTRVTLAASLAIIFASGAQGTSTDEHSQIKTALSQAKVSLAQAIEIARKEVKKGHLVEAELEMSDGRPTYEVEFLSGQAVKEVEIDGVSGKVLETETESIDEKHKDRVAAFEKALGQTKLTLTQAVEIAQKKVPGGKAYEAEFELEDGKLACEVELLAGGKFMEVEIDATTGKVLEVEEEGDDEHQAGAAWNFDKDSADKVPAAWSIRQTRPTQSMATWRVVADPSAPSKPNVMALTKTDNYNGTFNLAIAEKTSFKDLDLTVRVKAVSGEEDQGGGPIWRCKDENNYYICRFNPLEANYRVYRVKDGRRKQLESIKIKSLADKWYDVRVTMVGDSITCYLDGKKLLEARDGTFADAGMIGLWTKADAVTSFDDLVARTQGGEKSKAAGKHDHDHDDDDDDDDDHDHGHDHDHDHDM